jgi:hypothetical protein
MTVFTPQKCPKCGLDLIWDDDPTGFLYCRNKDDYDHQSEEVKRQLDDAQRDSETPEAIEASMPWWAKHDAPNIDEIDWLNWTSIEHAIPAEIKREIFTFDCWYCKQMHNKTVTNTRHRTTFTGIYLNRCKECGHDLEFEPRYGRGGPEDLALKKKRK